MLTHYSLVINSAIPLAFIIILNTKQTLFYELEKKNKFCFMKKTNFVYRKTAVPSLICI